MMILNKKTRPVAAFDAEDAEHRKHYAEFLERGTWGYCPIRFVADDVYSDLISHINDKMLQYYVAQEFPNLKRYDNKIKPLVREAVVE